MRELHALMSEYFGPLTDGELELVGQHFHEEKLNKNEFFTREGRVCDRLSFIRSGILRVYAYADGKEITQWIATENYLITEVIGFFFDQPNRWNILAFSDTELLTITRSDYLKLCSEFPKWLEIEKRFFVKCFAMIEDRVFAHLSMTARQRYELYFEQNKELFNQVPLQYIASVLGMTPETFSRIRKQQMGKS